MRYHLFQKFFGKMVKIKETSFLSTRGMYLSCHGCMYHQQVAIRMSDLNQPIIDTLGCKLVMLIILQRLTLHTSHVTFSVFGKTE